MGFRRFHLRGIKKVKTEFALIAMSHNLRKLHLKCKTSGHKRKKWLKNDIKPILTTSDLDIFQKEENYKP
jgi:hypothetical protein